MRAHSTMASTVTAGIRQRLHQAVALHQGGRLKEAEQLYRQILQADPTEPDANHNLGILARQGGDDNAALPYLRAARDGNPALEQYHLSYADALLACNRADEAIAALEFALGSGLNSTVVQKQLASLRTMTKDLRTLTPAMSQEQVNAIFRLSRGERFADLETLLRNLLARHPNSGFLWKMLGVTLARQNKESGEACQRAAALLPDDAEAQRNYGRLLLQNDRPREAHAHLLRVIACAASGAEDHLALGDVLRILGRTGEAIEQYQRALALDANLLEAHIHLGNAQNDANQTGQAEASYRNALKIKPDCAEAYCNLGIVLKVLLRNAEAEENCAMALKINPELVGALVLAANLALDNGKFAEAEALFRRALALDTQCAEALAGIANTRKMTSADEAWASQAAALADTHPAPEKESFLRYALGKYFDDTKNYQRAFPQYRWANELGKIIARRHGQPPFDPAACTESVERHIAWFERTGAQLTESGNPSARPVLIVGMPRSGTSLAEQILASHPAVFGAGELPFWGAAARRLQSGARDQAEENALIESQARDYLQLLDGFSGEARHVVDKMPNNFQHLGLIHLALPHARILHMRRNPIDTCLSIYFHSFAETQPYAGDLEHLAHYYREYERLMAYWRAALPPGVLLDVPYEALVEDQEKWTRAMLEHIGLEWDDRCLDFHRSERAVRTPSNWQVRQQITTSSVERWRNYEKFVGPLRSLVP
jgi:tetratricopeptide (TPR) repeat protein